MSYVPDEWKNSDGSWKAYSDEEYAAFVSDLADGRPAHPVGQMRTWDDIRSKSGGGSLTAGDGIAISGGKVSVKYSADANNGAKAGADKGVFATKPA